MKSSLLLRLLWWISLRTSIYILVTLTWIILFLWLLLLVAVREGTTTRWDHGLFARWNPDHGFDFARWIQDNGNFLLSVGKSPFEGFEVTRRNQDFCFFVGFQIRKLKRVFLFRFNDRLNKTSTSRKYKQWACCSANAKEYWFYKHSNKGINTAERARFPFL